MDAIYLCGIDGKYQVDIKRIPHTRTAKQNRAIHKYLTMLADDLNAGGWSVQQVLAQAVAREWTQEGAKENLWKPIQHALYDTDSTTQLETVQVSEVYEILNRHTSELFGVGMPFPSIDHG